VSIHRLVTNTREYEREFYKSPNTAQLSSAQLNSLVVISPTLYKESGIQYFWQCARSLSVGLRLRTPARCCCMSKARSESSWEMPHKHHFGVAGNIAWMPNSIQCTPHETFTPLCPTKTRNLEQVLFRSTFTLYVDLLFFFVTFVAIWGPFFFLHSMQCNAMQRNYRYHSEPVEV
jgi:hypothetical protein